MSILLYSKLCTNSSAQNTLTCTSLVPTCQYLGFRVPKMGVQDGFFVVLKTTQSETTRQSMSSWCVLTNALSYITPTHITLPSQRGLRPLSSQTLPYAPSGSHCAHFGSLQISFACSKRNHMVTTLSRMSIIWHVFKIHRCYICQYFSFLLLLKISPLYEDSEIIYSLVARPTGCFWFENIMNKTAIVDFKPLPNIFVHVVLWLYFQIYWVKSARFSGRIFLKCLYQSTVITQSAFRYQHLVLSVIPFPVLVN